MKKKLFLIAFAASSFLPSFGEVGDAYGYSFDFRFREDGTAEILSCSPKPSGDFMVPASLSYQIGENVWKNVSITSIYGAFSDCPDLTSVGFPVSIERIDVASFMWCTGLKSVDLPDNVKYVGVSAFGGCPITNLAIRGNCYVHGDAFPSCELESVSFSDDVVFSWGNYFNVSNQSLIDFISVPGITLLDGYAIPCLTNNVTIEWQLPKVLDLSAARGLAGFALTSYSIDRNTGFPGEVETIILSDSIKNIPP